MTPGQAQYDRSEHHPEEPPDPDLPTCWQNGPFSKADPSGAPGFYFVARLSRKPNRLYGFHNTRFC
jgi:hypothetical protein